MKAPAKKKSALTLIELLLSACIIFILMGIFSFYAETALRVTKETALRNELQNIRMAIEYYRIVKNRFPDELTDLQKEHYVVRYSMSGLIKQSFLGIFQDKRGDRLLDPFMNKYEYDNKTGRIWSGIEKYKTW